eukprot:g56427.t1
MSTLFFCSLLSLSYPSLLLALPEHTQQTESKHLHQNDRGLLDNVTFPHSINSSAFDMRTEYGSPSRSLAASIGSALLIAIGSSLDNLSIGFTFGVRSRRFPPLMNLLIALMNGLGTLVAAITGDRIKQYVTEDFGAGLVAGLFTVLGLLAIRQTLSSRPPAPPLLPLEAHRDRLEISKQAEQAWRSLPGTRRRQRQKPRGQKDRGELEDDLVLPLLQLQAAARPAGQPPPGSSSSSSQMMAQGAHKLQPPASPRNADGYVFSKGLNQIQVSEAQSQPGEHGLIEAGKPPLTCREGGKRRMAEKDVVGSSGPAIDQPGSDWCVRIVECVNNMAAGVGAGLAALPIWLVTALATATNFLLLAVGQTAANQLLLLGQSSVGEREKSNAFTRLPHWCFSERCTHLTAGMLLLGYASCVVVTNFVY